MRGNHIGYHAAHSRVRRARGPASRYPCVVCGGQASQWSYSYRDQHELRWRGLRYSADPRFYDPLCLYDHRRRDSRARRKLMRPPDTETQRWCGQCHVLHSRRRCPECGVEIDPHRLTVCLECKLMQGNRYQDTDSTPSSAPRGTQRPAGPCQRQPVPDITAGDRRRAAEMLAATVTGDKLGITAAVMEAQRADRIGSTVAAVAALVVEVVPALRSAAIVDRLRAVASMPELAPPPPAPTPPNAPAPARQPWRDAADVLANIRESMHLR
jgi:hypothetical protein